MPKFEKAERRKNRRTEKAQLSVLRSLSGNLIKHSHLYIIGQSLISTGLLALCSSKTGLEMSSFNWFHFHPYQKLLTKKEGGKGSWDGNLQSLPQRQKLVWIEALEQLYLEMLLRLERVWGKDRLRDLSLCVLDIEVAQEVYFTKTVLLPTVILQTTIRKQG